MSQSLEKILKNFPTKRNVSGTFVMKCLIILVKDHPLDPNLCGNHLKAMQV